jgi:M6 family metalloprotease-like protein
MRRSLLFILLLISSFSSLWAAPFRNIATYLIQPDGSRYDCFISGDEYYQFLHDIDGYVIVKNQADNWFYFATKDTNGNQIISGLKAGKGNPSEFGLVPNAHISPEAIQKKHNMYKMPERKSSAKGGLHEGTIRNLVVYIQFADDTDFVNTRSFYDDLFNSDTKKSLKDYYDEVSYGKLDIVSSHFPVCELTTNLAYVDSHNRNYYEPYDATTNPEGYQENQQAFREHTLLKEAIASVRESIESQFTSDELDIDGDGEIDNICFIVRGMNGAWNDLLWAHSWALYSYTVTIHNKVVYRYTWQPESQADVYTFCHEMFHALGAPDLYHYSYDGLSPAGPWDLMDGGFVQMGAWMKYRYANHTWITSIPEINQSGTYKLKPLASSDSNCYIIRSINSESEFYVVEYRSASGQYESNVPGSGLLVYRINPNLEGNADGPPDEVYIYRPGGTTTSNGNIKNAFYSSFVNRTQISDNTSPSGFLTNGSLGGLNISDIGEAGSTISFTVNIDIPEPVTTLFAQVSGTTSIALDWEPNADNDSVIIASSTNKIKSNPLNNKVYNVGDKLKNGETIIYTGIGENSYNQMNLNPGATYYYKIWSKNNLIYSTGVQTNATTYCDVTIPIPYSQDFSISELPDCWNIIDNARNNQIWEFANVGQVEFSSYSNSNGFASVNSAYFGLDQEQNTDLISPAFDFTNKTFIYLQFSHLLKIDLDRTEAEFLYSVDSSKTWNSLQTWTSSTNNTELYSVDLSDLLSGQPNVRFKWSYSANADRYWCIDDFRIIDELIAVEAIKNKTGTTVSPYRNKVVTIATTVTKVHPAFGCIFTQDTSTVWSGLPINLESTDNLWSILKEGDSVIVTALIKDESSIPKLSLPDIKIVGTSSLEQIPVKAALNTIQSDSPEKYNGLYVKCDSLKVEGWDNDWFFSENTCSVSIKNADTQYSFKTGELFNIAGIYYQGNEQAYLVPLSDNHITKYVDVNENSKLSSLKPYPNPFSDYLVIELSMGAVIEITDLSGKVILREYSNGDKPSRINTGHLLPGVYLIEITDKNQRVIYKAIKSN